MTPSLLSYRGYVHRQVRNPAWWIGSVILFVFWLIAFDLTTAALCTAGWLVGIVFLCSAIDWLFDRGKP